MPFYLCFCWNPVISYLALPRESNRFVALGSCRSVRESVVCY